MCDVDRTVNVKRVSLRLQRPNYLASPGVVWAFSGIGDAAESKSAAVYESFALLWPFVWFSYLKTPETCPVGVAAS